MSRPYNSLEAAPKQGSGTSGKGRHMDHEEGLRQRSQDIARGMIHFAMVVDASVLLRRRCLPSRSIDNRR